MNKEIIIYLAGFTDGEGMIAVSKRGRTDRFSPSYEGRLFVGNTSEAAMSLYVKTFGGGITPSKKQTKGGKTYYNWWIYGVPMVKALEAMLPFLQVKKQEAKLVIALQKRIREHSKKIGERVNPQELEAREELYQQIKKLTGKPRQLSLDIKDSPPRLL